MEEALRCRAYGAVIGELRHGELDAVAVRRLSLAAAESGALALLLRGSPPRDALHRAPTRWIVVRRRARMRRFFAVRLTRNRRGPLGSWMLQWSDDDERFVLATHAQPVAAPAADRPHRKVRSCVSKLRRSPSTASAAMPSCSPPWTTRRSGSGFRPASRWRRRAPCIPRSTRSRKTPRPTRTLLEAIADWCLRYTPLVACDAPDGLLLDITGCAHLYGGEDALVADLSGAAGSGGLRLPHGHRRQHRRGLGRRASR